MLFSSYKLLKNQAFYWPLSENRKTVESWLSSGFYFLQFRNCIPMCTIINQEQLAGKKLGAKLA